MDIATPQIFADLMNSLHRFFKIGIYYPAGHAVADQAAASFLRTLRLIAGKESTYVRVTVSENSLAIQGIELGISVAAAQYFHNLLHSLSISALDIHRDINAEELRLFLSRLLFLRTSLQNSRDFKEVKITGLPSTVKVHQLQFLASQSGSENAGTENSSQPTIDHLLSSLAQHGLKEDQIEICRKLLNSIPAALSKKNITESDLPSVSWQDVEKLLVRVAGTIKSPGKESESPQPNRRRNIDALVSIFKSMERGTDESKSRDAVNLLVKMMKGTQPSVPVNDQKTPVLVDRNDPSAMSIPELHHALDPLKDRPLPADLLENNRSESLSILMQMLDQDHRLHVTMRMQEAFRNCLATPLEVREWRVVVRGMQHLLKTQNSEHLEHAILMILDTLRRSEHTTPLIFLLDVCQGLMKAEFVTCWPYLVNEAFIAGSQNDPEIFQKICSTIGLLSLQEMHSNLHRLEKLDALNEKRIAPTIFSPPPASLNTLFLLLFNSSQMTYIAKLLVNGLRHHSLGWLDKAVAPLLDYTLPAHQQFLFDLLKEKEPNKPSRSLKKNGAMIIVEKLPLIPAELRNAGWVAPTIAALVRSPVPQMEDMLDTIIKSRHWLIIPDWPGPCRNAARQVLNTIR